MFLLISLYCLVGALAGLASGLFGIGGGIIIIPALCYVFLKFGIVPGTELMHMAVGTSLAIIIVTSATSAYSHNRRGLVRWDRVKHLLPGLMVGTAIGALIAGFLPSHGLRIFFGLFLIYVGIKLVFPSTISQDKPGPSSSVTRGISLFLGALSGMLGVGGGVLLVPFLLRCQLDMREAVATSVMCAMVIGCVATICFMITGTISPGEIPWSTGYIYWPAFLAVGATSIIFAPMGALLVHHVPRHLLKRIFGCVVLLIALDMLFFVR